MTTTNYSQGSRDYYYKYKALKYYLKNNYIEKQKQIKEGYESSDSKEEVLLLCHANKNNGRSNDENYNSTPYNLYNITDNSNITYMDIKVVNTDETTIKQDFTKKIDNPDLQNKFDFILSINCDMDSYGLLKNDESIINVIDNISNLLKKNGRCYISVPLFIFKMGEENIVGLLKSENNNERRKMRIKNIQPSINFIKELNKRAEEYVFKYYIKNFDWYKRQQIEYFKDHDRDIIDKLIENDENIMEYYSYQKKTEDPGWLDLILVKL